jgi:hypothetical protein
VNTGIEFAANTLPSDDVGLSKERTEVSDTYDAAIAAVVEAVVVVAAVVAVAAEED